MTHSAQQFSLDELCALADTPRRTVRYYIQQGLVDRPEGIKKSAYYTSTHLEQLLAIRKWQRAGLRLERIKELLAEPNEDQQIPPAKPKQPGDVSVWSHLFIAPGVELRIEPSEAELSPEQLRDLARKVAALMINKDQVGMK